MFAAIEGPDILIVLAVVLVLFGSTQIPKLARSLGSASKEFKRGQDEEHVAEPVVGAVSTATTVAGQPAGEVAVVSRPVVVSPAAPNGSGHSGSVHSGSVPTIPAR